MAKNLIQVSTFSAENGRPFDLLATDDLKEFYIDLEQLAASLDDYHEFLIGTTTAESLTEEFDSAFTAVVNGEKTCVVSVEQFKACAEREELLFHEFMLSKTFPVEIFEAVKRPFPAPVTILETSPAWVYNTDGKNSYRRIFIYEHANEYLIYLNNINYLLTGGYDWSPALVKAVLRDFIVSKYEYKYFCRLDAVPNIFTDIGTKAARKLARRFEEQVFMTPTPCKINSVKLNCKLFHDEPWEGGEFKIYKGVGFVQNGFFFRTDELSALLGCVEKVFGMFTCSKSSISFEVMIYFLFARPKRK